MYQHACCEQYFKMTKLVHMYVYEMSRNKRVSALSDIN